jgi:hypothetical protein
MREKDMHLQGIAQRGESKLLYSSQGRFHQKREGGLDERDAAMQQLQQQDAEIRPYIAI